ncbi:MAG: hypothetical protein ACT4OM_07435 [Actinomycetota bacterium]
MTAFMLAAVMMMVSPASAQTVLASSVTNAGGGFSFSGTIPSNTAAGIYRLTARCTALSYPVPPAVPVAVNDTTVEPGQVITISAANGSHCSGAVAVQAVLALQSAAAGFSIAQVAIANEGSINILVQRAGTLNPGLGSPFGNQVIPVPGSGSDSRGPIIINNNNSSSSSSSAAAAAGGGVAVTPNPPQTLVRTGVDALPLAASGAAVMLLGFVLLSAGNRTRPGFASIANR